MKSFLLVLTLFVWAMLVAAPPAFAQSNASDEPTPAEEATTKENKEAESDLNQERTAKAKAEHKEYKAKAKEARRAEKDAQHASREAEKTVKLEKKAQKARKIADKQSRKANKAAKKSDRNIPSEN